MKSIQRNDLFDYGYFIYQNADYFKFSIDSVLLAEFVSVRKNQKYVLDMCSGNAPVPMILYKKYGDKLELVGVELQKEVYDLGIKSLEYNKLIDKILFFNDDIKHWQQVYSGKQFDIITCNPPYFKVTNNSYINENRVKALARHEIEISLEEIIKIASKLIKNQGYFYLIHRVSRLAEVITILNKYNFGIKKIEFVYDKRGSNAELFLIESIYNGKNDVKIGDCIYLKEHKSYQGIFDEVR